MNPESAANLAATLVVTILGLGILSFMPIVIGYNIQIIKSRLRKDVTDNYIALGFATLFFVPNMLLGYAIIAGVWSWFL